MSLERINIDGSPVLKPSYARHVSDAQFGEYVINSDGFTGRPVWVWESTGGSVLREGGINYRILEQTAKDPNLPKYLKSLIQNGNERTGDRFSTQLAEHLARKGGMLELSWSKPHGEETKPAFPRIGTFLEKGTIICRGNVEKISALRGGTLIIDGDVDELSQCDSGIVYINGNLNKLKQSDKVILIVCGNLEEYEQSRRSGGGLNREITPSPFIFTTHPVTSKEPHSYYSDKRDVDLSKKVYSEPESTVVVHPALIKNWEPEDVEPKAIELAVKRIKSYFDNLNSLAGKLTTPKDLAEFAKVNMYGYVSGHTSGYYQGANDHGPSGD